MGNEVAVHGGNGSSLATLDMTPDKLDLLKRTICKGATDDELALFAHVCKRTGLDPFAKQIHAIKRKSKNQQGQWVEVMSYQTGIDGYRLTAARTGEHAGTSEPLCVDCHTDNGKCPDCKESGGHPLKATVTVKRIVKGIICEWTASALWKEYRQTKSEGGLNKFWKLMPHGQLGKCAEALALRKAFPAELSGLYTHEEMGQADNETIQPVVLPKPAPFRAAPPPTPTVVVCKPEPAEYIAPDGMPAVVMEPPTDDEFAFAIPAEAPPSPAKAPASASDPVQAPPVPPIIKKATRSNRSIDWRPEVRKEAGLISEKQFKRMWALYKGPYLERMEASGVKEDEAELEFKQVLATLDIAHSDGVPWKKYDDVCNFLSPGSNKPKEGGR